MKLYTQDDYVKLKSQLKSRLDGSKLVSFVNPFSFYHMLDNDKKYDVDGFFVDGISLVQCLRLKYRIDLTRISFDRTSIADDFLEFCSKNCLRVSFIGATSDEFLIFSKKITESFPDLDLGYSRDGYLRDDEFSFLISQLNDSDVIILGMGSPIQEYIGTLLKHSLNNKFIITCGGFITQYSLAEDYYPKFFDKYNLRWMYRLFNHSHVRRKFFTKYPKFFLRFFLSGESINISLNL